MLPAAAVVVEEKEKAPLTKQAKAAREAKEKKKPVQPEELVIPEHLAPHSGDTERERDHKRKVIKRLKQDFKRKKRDTEADERKTSWLDFQKGLKGRGTKRKSIWATPDVIKGNEGVTGGVGMTEFEQRKRHVFANDEDDD